MRIPAASLPARAALVVLALLAAAAGAAEIGPGPATVLVHADLRRSPGDMAQVVGGVSAGDDVEVLEVRFDQALVEGNGERGWMPVEKLGARGESAAPGAGGRTLLGALGESLSGGGRSRTEGARTVTMGVRGLQREDLAAAAPDPQAVERLEAWRASPRDGLAYGEGAGLRSREVEYVEAGR